MTYEEYCRKVDAEWINSDSEKPTDEDVKEILKDEDDYYWNGGGRFTKDLNNKTFIKNMPGGAPKLNEEETHLLERCASIDMLSMLKEEFTNNPIILDENGGLVK